MPIADESAEIGYVNATPYMFTGTLRDNLLLGLRRHPVRPSELGEEAAKKGTMVSFGGLKPTSSGARMRITNGKVVTTDGPFTESKEVIGGFSIFNLASKEEALEEARKFTELHRVHWPKWEGEIEIRLMYEEEDDVRAVQVEASRLLEHVGGVRG